MKKFWNIEFLCKRIGKCSWQNSVLVLQFGDSNFGGNREMAKKIAQKVVKEELEKRGEALHDKLDKALGW